MVNSIGDILSGLNFNELHQIFLSNNYYNLLFPFLLVFAVIYTVLSSKKVKIFRSKKTDEPYNSVIFIISLVISFFGVSFQVSQGQSVGDLMMMLFPNISALSMGILSFYIVGSILNKNFFKGLFNKKYSSFVYMAVGVIGLGAVMYYVGIAMGFWNFQPFDQSSYWNFVIALFLLILGVTFLFIDLVPVGILFLIVFGVYVYNSGSGTILDYFMDPVIFIIIIIIVLLSWLNSDKEAKGKLAKKLKEGEESLGGYRKLYGHKPKDYESRIHDIVDTNYAENMKKWHEKYGNESWR